MAPQLSLFFLCFAVFAASLFGTFFWLAIPMLLQVIVDKAIGQNSPDTLTILGLALLVCTLFASGSEVGIGVFTQLLARGELISRKKLLQFAAVLARVLAIGVLLTIYSPQVAFATIVLTAIACGASVFVAKSGSSKTSFPQPLPLSFRLPLTLVVLFVLWYGAFQVLADQLLLGQWLAVGVLSLQFAATLLSFSMSLL
jgi:hypothetical protein